MNTNTDPVRAQAWAKLEREWAIDGMPADKIRLARAAFDAGAALAQQPASVDEGFVSRLAEALADQGWDVDPDGDGSGIAQLRAAALAAQQQGGAK